MDSKYSQICLEIEKWKHEKLNDNFIFSFEWNPGIPKLKVMNEKADTLAKTGRSLNVPMNISMDIKNLQPL